MIREFCFAGEGMRRVYENPKWMVGIKNWKPQNDITGIDCVERHNETDELFVLVSGRCTLLFAEETADGLRMEPVEMQAGKVYCVPQGAWHNTITQRDTKLILIEDVNTSGENSDTRQLSPAEIETVKGFF